MRDVTSWFPVFGRQQQRECKDPHQEQQEQDKGPQQQREGKDPHQEQDDSVQQVISDDPQQAESVLKRKRYFKNSKFIQNNKIFFNLDV